jgi:hypothetical protein
LERVVSPGSVNTYRFFSNDGSDQYSAGLTVSATALTYGPTECVEPFCYTNGAILAGADGGHGWSGSWTESSSGSYAVNPGSFADVVGYSLNHGNKILVTPPDAENRFAYRNFGTANSGKIFVSFLVNFEFAGATKFAGVSLMDVNLEKAFFGEIGTVDQTLGLFDGSSDMPSGFAMNAAVGNEYLVIGLYDFSTHTLKVKGYWKTDTLPLVEPESWDAQTSVVINQVTGIRLGAGAVTGTPGKTYFDEVRVSTTWSGLLNLKGSVYTIR